MRDERGRRYTRVVGCRVAMFLIAKLLLYILNRAGSLINEA